MLPPETEKTWHFLSTQRALAGFVLVGGSALALRIHHRLSEDLDLAWPAPQLPRARIDALRHSADETGFTFKRNDDETAAREFAEGGLALHDYQQDFLVHGLVKVSLFAPDPPMVRILAGQPSETGPRLATLQEIFQTKCLVSAVRSKSRDWIDLFLLLRDHGFTLHDYAAVFAASGDEAQRAIGLSRLCSGVPQKDDEGYVHLLDRAPSLEEMKAFFVARRNEWEIETAREHKRSHDQS